MTAPIVAQQLARHGVAVFPCTGNKAPATRRDPATGRGIDWRIEAQQPVESMVWPSGLVGVPVPPGVVIVDVDTYKGVTRAEIETAIGCALPWDAALLQRTQSGGEHYAFRTTYDVRQGSDIKIRGLDTRTAGRGYIATGAGYEWVSYGLARLAWPESLPVLPDACRPTLERVARPVPDAVELPEGDRDIDTIRAALKHIDADCTRSEWVEVGMGLKHHFYDDPDTGLALFREWSESAAHRLDYDSLEPQWNSFKASGSAGTVTVGSIMYRAIQNGYQPPRSIDIAAAFGGVKSAPSEVFDDLIDRIQATGGDPKATDALVTDLCALRCNDLQRATLAAALTRELKDAGLMTTTLRRQIEGLVRTGKADAPERQGGDYGKNHTENAVKFLEDHYPTGHLVRSDQVWYQYNGKAWEAVEDDAIHHQIFAAMAAHRPQEGTLNGTYNVLTKLCFTPHQIGSTPENLIVVQNGVLDVETWQMYQHDPRYFTTNLRPYEYQPAAACPEWLRFLHTVFEGDEERIALLQEWFGYMIGGGYRHQKIMLLIGAKRGGKGTIGRMLQRIVGAANFSGGSLRSFSDDAYLDSLRTKPVVFIGDAEKSIHPLAAGAVIERLKTISGYDEISFNRKYKSTLTERLPCRVTVACNSIPKLFDDSGALSGRLLVLPFDLSFEGQEDHGLFDRLASELEGIATWSLAGLARLRESGRFTEPSASLDETQQIREQYSPLVSFITEQLIDAPGAVMRSRDLYDVYAAWAIANREDRILSQKRFISDLKDATRGRWRYGSHRDADGQVVRGFRDLAVSGAVSPAGTAAAFSVVEGGKA